MATPLLTDAAAGGACAGRLDVLSAMGDQVGDCHWCMFITAGPIIKLCAGGGGGH
jgi:hypothetical protein